MKDQISDTFINLPRLFQKNQRKHNGQSDNLTWLSTISSARISLMVHPPPMRNEISLPAIRKQGEIRVPWGRSASPGCKCPAGSLSLGRFSPPLSTSPLADWRFLYCVPLDCHQMLAGKWKLCLSFPMRRFHLQSQSCKLVRKKKEEIFIPQNTLWLSFDIINSPLQFCIYLYCSVRQWTLKDICSETLYQCIQLDTCHCLNMDCCCRDSV